MPHVQCGELYGDDPEPSERMPAGRLCVPVRPVAHGCAARLFRTPVGARTAVAFTTPARLRAVLGADQPWTSLAEPALRALVRPLGIDALTVDPTLTAPGTGTGRGAGNGTGGGGTGAGTDTGRGAIPGTGAPGGTAPVRPLTASAR
ncbi:SAV_915 family protein [Streptomyces sp. NPDC050600]|uniref:SAV_915 family protein n=1 Tax=Streptomyces sp. NPDC050600 TaxID=3157213 RepID=UPI0034239F2E